MEAKKLASMLFGMLACALAANDALAQAESKMTTEIPRGIAIPDERLDL